MMSFSVCLFTQIASLLQDSPDAGISPWRLRTASATEKLPKPGKSIRDFKQYCCDHCTVFVTVCFWNGTCLPKPLYTKFPLVSAALHNENFHCALRLERASLHLVKRKGKRQRPALTQNSASPTWHSPELRKVCRQNQNSLEIPTKPPTKESWFLRAMVEAWHACCRWTAGRKREFPSF